MNENKSIATVTHPAIESDIGLMLIEIAERHNAVITVREKRVKPSYETFISPYGFGVKRTGEETYREYVIYPGSGGKR